MAQRAFYLAFACLLSPFFAPAGQIETKSPSGPVMSRCEAMLREGRHAEAKACFEDAEKLPGADTAEMNAGVAIAELQLGNYEAARQRETRVLELVSKPRERAEAHEVIGTTWLRESYQADGLRKAEELREAEKEFREAVALDLVFDSAYFNLGTVLSQEGRMSDAAAAFRNSIEAAGRNPESATGLPLRQQGRAPLFTVMDRTGQTVSLESLRGTFVLLDFWATWCPPCIRALPVLRQLATFFPANQFTVISIDEDSDNQAAWSEFVARQGMDWTQIWDQNSNIYYAFHGFGAAARPQMVLPRYVLIDPAGLVLHVYTGTDRVGKMAGEIVRTVDAAHAQPQKR